MDKILEALGKLLPENQVHDVADALKGMLEESKTDLEKQFEEKLEEAYAQSAEELASAEKIAVEGYQQAWTAIQELRNRLEIQKEEFEQQLESGYAEALEEIRSEQGKNENIEVEMYEEYEKKLEEMRDYIVEKVDQFLKLKGTEIYEQAKRDVVNDPRMVEHKVALDRIIEVAQNYISDEDYSYATSSKVAYMNEEVENLKNQVKILEARSFNVSRQKDKLEEALREKDRLLTEQVKVVETQDKKERTEKASQASGRGKKVVNEVIAEYSNTKDTAEEVLEEEVAQEYHDLNVLAGLSQS